VGGEGIERARGERKRERERERVRKRERRERERRRANHHLLGRFTRVPFLTPSSRALCITCRAGPPCHWTCRPCGPRRAGWWARTTSRPSPMRTRVARAACGPSRPSCGSISSGQAKTLLRLSLSRPDEISSGQASARPGSAKAGRQHPPTARGRWSGVRVRRWCRRRRGCLTALQQGARRRGCLTALQQGALDLGGNKVGWILGLAP
jgi:hypothetical protein